MSLYTWLVLGVTVGYIIYYAVMIMNDLYANKGNEKSTAETIDLPSGEEQESTEQQQEEEAPVYVDESDYGISSSDFTPITAEDAPPAETPQNEAENAEQPKPSVASEVDKEVQAAAESTQAAWSDAYEGVSFNAALVNGGVGKPKRPRITIEECEVQNAEPKQDSEDGNNEKHDKEEIRDEL